MSEIQPTPAQKEVIRHGIEKNPLFRYLDEEQKEALVRSVKLKKYQKGTTIISEDDIGDNFFIIDSGKVEVFQKNDLGGKRTRGFFKGGDSFGEKAMFYGTRRSASCGAVVDTECWVVDRPTFHKVLTSSKQKLESFTKFATAVDKSNEKVMKPTDFFRSFFPEMEAQSKSEDDLYQNMVSKYPRLETLFRLVDRSNAGAINFLDYCLFDVMASKPDPFLDFAFLLFDEGKKGYVIKEDIQKMLQSQGNTLNGFDFNSSSAQLFFGKNGTRKLHFLSFCEFFLALQEEIPIQAFWRVDQNSSGLLNGDQFVHLLEDFGYWRMPTKVLERVKAMRGLDPSREGVTFAEFVAFNNLLKDLPGIFTILEHATHKNGGKPVSKAQFVSSAQALTSARPSPLELQIIYNICDPQRTNSLSVHQFTELVNLVQQHELPQSQKVSTHLTPKERFKEATINFLLGSIAGCIGAAAVYPIDFVKTRLQNQPYDQFGKGTIYSGIIDCVKKTVKNEGFLGLYRGLPAQFVGVAPEKAIKLATNDFLRGVFKREGDAQVRLPFEIVSGACAGGMQVFFTNPYELVKIRLQWQGAERMKNPAFVPKPAFQIVREMGFSGMYKGASACWLRDIPFSAIYFPTYAHSKQMFHEPLGMSDLLLAGAIAGVPAAYLVTPADVVKTRLQAQSKTGVVRFSGMKDCFVKTYQNEGFKTFFVGGGMRVFRSSPQFAVTLLFYELLQKNFAPNMQQPRPLVSVPISSQEYGHRNNLQRFIPI
eukprot:c21556_g1_i1.p1 GENE.c21556_g1_i1~~c21556_g1_i1.p1  ORF type:complete len:762 (-),score=380.30 c21556_g1_i1:53-2338(-)